MKNGPRAFAIAAVLLALTSVSPLAQQPDGFRFKSGVELRQGEHPRARALSVIPDLVFRHGALPHFNVTLTGWSPPAASGVAPRRSICGTTPSSVRKLTR